MINTEQQLRAASDRLGVDFEEMKALFFNRIPSPSFQTENHSPFTFTHGALSFQSAPINTALDNSLLPICEKVFGDPLSQDTSISPATSSPCSSPSRDCPQHPESASAASVSSSAAALLQGASKALSDHSSHSVDHDDHDDHSESHSEPTPPRTRAISRRVNNLSTATRISKRNLSPEGEKPTTPKLNNSVPLRSTSSGQSLRVKPLDPILSFARGTTSTLADVSNLKHENATGLVRSLAVIPGCDAYRDCCVFDYIGVLFNSHLSMLDTQPDDPVGKDQTKLCYQNFEITESSWKAHIFACRSSENKDFAMNQPPTIRRTVDLLQFIYRLVDKVSNYQDGLTAAFLEGLYTTDVPALVASLTTKLLQRGGGIPLNGSDSEGQTLLHDWCIRLLKDFIVYEVSPVSRVRHMKSLPVEKFAVFGFGKGEMPPLVTVIGHCLQSVSSHHTTKEGRHALCELVQAFLIWSLTRNSEGDQDSILDTINGGNEHENLDLLVGNEAFWTMVVQPVLQQVNKEPQLSDSIFEYTFLSSLLSIAGAKRVLFDGKHDKCKQMLLNLMIRILALLNRDLLSSFRSAEEMRRLHPGVHTSIDFVHSVISSAAIQREILGSEPATRGQFLSSLELLITNTVKLVRYPLDADGAARYTRKGPFAKVPLRDVDAEDVDSGRESSRISQKKGTSTTSLDDEIIAREKAVAFAAKVIGCAGKSVEDGSWDMSQMNSMKALFETRIISSRSRYRLWNDVYRIWRVVQKKIGQHVLLSEAERSSFAMVVEVVRKHAAYDSTDRTDGTTSRDSMAEVSTCAPLSLSNGIEAVFPPILEVGEMRRAVCSQKGYEDFDDDGDILKLLKDGLISKGQQMLARYDPDSEFVVKWIRLQKKNSYIGRARDLLERADRTVGLKCSCVPGYLKKGGNETETRIACSSDLCENRHMKIECVPGSCGAQSYCMNQRMQRMEYAKFKMISFPGKGIGIVADEDIPEGALIGEYQGEVVTMEEYEKRVREYEGERHFYFMTLTNKLVIDASRKSQATRFLNHSCDPNSETQKWNADGEPRVGIFAKRAIKRGEEITFDYGARSLARYSAKCLCGAHNCRGLLALRQENKESTKELDSEGVLRTGFTAEKVKHASSDRADEVDGQISEEDRRRSIIKEKIEVAHRYLRNAEALGRNVQENSSRNQDFVLSTNAKEKLNAWKLSLSERPIPSFSLKASKDIRMEVTFPRIPRRGGAPTPLDKRTTEKCRGDMLGRNGSSIRNSPSRLADPPSVVKPDHSSTPKRRVPSAGRWALFEETFSAKTAPVLTSVKRYPDVDKTRRFSKLAKADFLPTTSKLKREQPIRPRVAKRRRTRRREESDSMDEYSTASEAEPILEEPIMSPTRLPDGNGACSDDEFIAAPPVESIQHSPCGRRWNPSDQGSRMLDDRPGGRKDYRGTGQDLDVRRPRLGPGKVAPGFGLVGVRTPEEKGWSGGVRVDYGERYSRRALPFDTSGLRRHRGYRRERSPSMEEDMHSQPRNLDKKRREERDSEGTKDSIHQGLPNFLPTFSPDERKDTHTRFRIGPEHNLGANAGERKSSGQSVGSPRSQFNKELKLRDTGIRDTNRALLMGQSRFESRSTSKVERDDPAKIDEGERSRDGRESSHPSRYPRGVKPQRLNMMSHRPIMDLSQEYGKELRDLIKPRYAKAGLKGDLRNIIGHRTKSKY